MMKHEELTDPKSCMSKALDREITFVLLARDACAPLAINAWCAERISSGKNKPTDPEIREAIECAKAMERQRRGIQHSLKEAVSAKS